MAIHEYVKPKAHLLRELEEKIQGYVQQKRYFLSQHQHAERWHEEADRLRQQAAKMVAQADKLIYDVDHWREGYDSANDKIVELREQIALLKHSDKVDALVDEINGKINGVTQ